MKTVFTVTDSRGLIIALAVTAGVHLALAAGIVWGGWLEAVVVSSPKNSREVTMVMNLNPSHLKKEQQNSFVEVEPNNTQPPEKQTPLYSNAQSRAANPDPAPHDAKALVDGENDLFPGVFDRPSAALKPLPKAAQSEPKSAPQPKAKATISPQKSTPQPARPIAVIPGMPVQSQDAAAALEVPLQPSDVLGVPDLPHVNPTLPAQPGSPTLSDVNQRLAAGVNASRKTKQDAGTKREGPSALDVRLTGYGDYDARFVNAVRQAWLRYRDSPGWFHPGRVVIQFKLHHNGAITDLSVNSTTAKPLQVFYCRQALEGPAPFPKWTPAMRREIGAESRRCQFSFHYLLRR